MILILFVYFILNMLKMKIWKRLVWVGLVRGGCGRL